VPANYHAGTALRAFARPCIRAKHYIGIVP